jgi:hypothetical protein
MHRIVLIIVPGLAWHVMAIVTKTNKTAIILADNCGQLSSMVVQIVTITQFMSYVLKT